VLYKSLSKHGFSVGALHGDLPQSVRFATLEKFKNNELQLLVCSDVAARGIDIGGLSHVFNFDLPFHAEDYVHRIGRTGRAGREGHAYSIATADDAKLLASIEALTGREIPRITVDGIEPVTEEDLAEARESKTRGRGRGGRGKEAPGAKGGRGRRDEKPRDGKRDAKPEGEAPRARREDGPRDEIQRRGRRRDEEVARVPAPALAEEPVPAVAPPAAREDGYRSREEHRRYREEERARAPREDRPREERVRDERPRDDRARDERPRDDRPRDDRPRRDDRNRDEHRRGGRDRDDLGPSVVGFGDAVPAFMLIPMPRPRRDRAAEAAADTVATDRDADAA